ncbi:DUF924 domain-containing protein [Oligoflexaceae bacterium]|nr:DUF924 domain-containing protein [Oligoflexaceae bacterium]
MNYEPEQIISHWIGPLLQPSDATEENWRQQMLKWRVGVYARGAVNAEFQSWQETVQSAYCFQEANDPFASEKWQTPRGHLAKLLILDQFSRAVFRGTPLAYHHDELCVKLATKICDSGWDTDEYNIFERLWVCVALSHPESKKVQELSVEKWMQWSRDLVSEVPEELRTCNQKVSWFFVKSIIEHAEAILDHQRFPHRNAVLCRNYRANECYYLANDNRPVWSYTQPPRPLYYAMHTILHRATQVHDCESITKPQLTQFAKDLELSDSAKFISAVSARADTEVTFSTLFAAVCDPENRSVLKEIEHSTRIKELNKKFAEHIYSNSENSSWPPKSAKRDICKTIDVSGMIAMQECKLMYESSNKINPSSLSKLDVEKKSLKAVETIEQSIEVAQKYYQDTHDKIFSVSGAEAKLTWPSLNVEFCREQLNTLFPSLGKNRKLCSDIIDLLSAGSGSRVPLHEFATFLMIYCPLSLREKIDLLMKCFYGRAPSKKKLIDVKLAIQQSLLKSLSLAELINRSFPDDEDSEGFKLEIGPDDFIDGYQIVELQTEDGAYNEDDLRDDIFVWCEKYPLFTKFSKISSLISQARRSREPKTQVEARDL